MFVAAPSASRSGLFVPRSLARRATTSVEVAELSLNRLELCQHTGPGSDDYRWLELNLTPAGDVDVALVPGFADVVQRSLAVFGGHNGGKWDLQMPRYRFNWENIPSALREQLADDAGTGSSSALDALRKRYGARPKEDFVRECWATLRDQWLAEDGAARAAVVAGVREAGLGSDVDVSTPDGEVALLRGLRNAKTLRTVVLRMFHELGEAAGPVTEPSSKAKEEDPRVKIGRGRKYVGFRQAAESPTGREFIGTLMSLLGESEPVPVGKIGETHVFVVPGPGRRALIAESHGQPSQDCWHSTIAFRTDDPKPLEATLQLSRWDPALALGADAVRGATRAQRREWDEERSRRAETGDDEVHYRELDTPADALPLASLTAVEVRAAWERIDEIAPPQPESEAPQPGPAQDQVVVEDVGPLLLETLRRETGNPSLEWDEDGEVGIRFGSTMVFVKTFGSPPIVRVYASVLSQVTASALEIEAVLAELNRVTALTKWLAVDSQVVAVIDLFGSPYSDPHVVHACHVVGSSADDMDEQLQARLGGKTFFGEHVVAPAPVNGPMGYL